MRRPRAKAKARPATDATSPRAEAGTRRCTGGRSKARDRRPRVSGGPRAGTAGAIAAEEELEGNVLQAAQTLRWKIILANPENPRGQPAEQLFDLVADPGEQNNLFGKGKKAEAELAKELDRLSTEAQKYSRAAEQRSIDGATQERLKALGYVD